MNHQPPKSVMVDLYCGCKVTEEGKFVVGEQCKNCPRCLDLKGKHPFDE